MFFLFFLSLAAYGPAAVNQEVKCCSFIFSPSPGRRTLVHCVIFSFCDIPLFLLFYFRSLSTLFYFFSRAHRGQNQCLLYSVYSILYNVAAPWRRRFQQGIYIERATVAREVSPDVNIRNTREWYSWREFFLPGLGTFSLSCDILSPIASDSVIPDSVTSATECYTVVSHKPYTYTSETWWRRVQRQQSCSCYCFGVLHLSSANSDHKRKIASSFPSFSFNKRVGNTKQQKTCPYCKRNRRVCAHRRYRSSAWSGSRMAIWMKD